MLYYLSRGDADRWWWWCGCGGGGRGGVGGGEAWGWRRGMLGHLKRRGREGEQVRTYIFIYVYLY